MNKAFFKSILVCLDSLSIFFIHCGRSWCWLFCVNWLSGSNIYQGNLKAKLPLLQIHLFSEEDFSATRHKILGIRDSQCFLLFCTLKLWDSKFYVVREQGECGLKAPGWGGKAGSFLPVQNLCPCKIQKWSQEQDLHPQSFSSSQQICFP